MLDLTKPRDLGQILNTAWLLYKARFRLFAAIAVFVVAPIDVLTLGVFDGELWSGFDWDTLIGQGDSTSGISQAIVMMFVGVPLITAAHVSAVMEIGAGNEPSARSSLERAGAVFTTLLATVALVLLGTIGGFILLIIPGIYLAVRWYVAVQAVVAEGHRPTDAMRRSGRLVEGMWWRVFGISIVIGLVGGTASAVLGLPFSILAAAVDVGILHVFGSIIFDSIAYSFTALGATILFFDLRARKDPAAAVPAPPTPAV